MTKEHVRTARAFGCGPVRLFTKHVLQNSLIPILTRIIFALPFIVIALEFYNSLKLKEKKVITYEGLYHEIYNEPEKEKVFTDMKTWIKN